MWNYGPKGKWYGLHRQIKISDMDVEHIKNCIAMFDHCVHPKAKVAKKIIELEKELDKRNQRRIQK